MSRATWVLGVAVALPVALTGCTTSGTTGDSLDSASTQGSFSNQEYAAAVELARQEIDKASGPSVSSATATVASGKVQNPNVDGACHSGRLLHISLSGRSRTSSPPATRRSTQHSRSGPSS